MGNHPDSPLFRVGNFLILFYLSSVYGFVNSELLQPLNVYYFEPPFKQLSQVTEVPKNHKNMTCKDLKVDESCLMIQSNIDKKIKFQYASMECYKCALQDRLTIYPHEGDTFTVKYASLGSVWKIVDEKNKTICSQEEHYLGENSLHTFYVNDTGCSLVCKRPQTFNEIYLPIVYAVAFYALLALTWILAKYIKRKEIFNYLFRSNSLDVSADLVNAYSTSASLDEKKKAAQKRLRALDTVRGLSVVIMIFVNYGGGKYWFFHHSRWNGLTIADLVFPWFMWMMGMSMALSMRSLLRKAVPRKKIFYKIVKRSVILFALGLMLNTYCLKVYLSDIRIPGVLQRFGITYFIVATVHLFYASAQDDQTSSVFRDLTPYGVEWLIMCTLLVTHILLTFLVHSTDCPRGYLGPGGLHDNGMHSLCTGGAAGFIDREILGTHHLYQRPSFKEIYQTTLPYDPEGILGYLTSVFLVFLGLQAGKILLTYKDSKNRLIRWIIWSFITGIIAAILCLCSKEGGYIPVNKNLWSVSFIMATGSLAFALMSICYYVIDVRKIWSGAPFYYAGMNPILLYVGHEITTKMFPWSWEIDSNHMSELFQDLWGTSLWVLISVYLYHKNFFLAI